MCMCGFEQWWYSHHFVEGRAKGGEGGGNEKKIGGKKWINAYKARKNEFFSHFLLKSSNLVQFQSICNYERGKVGKLRGAKKYFWLWGGFECLGMCAGLFVGECIKSAVGVNLFVRVRLRVLGYALVVYYADYCRLFVNVCSQSSLLCNTTKE